MEDMDCYFRHYRPHSQQHPDRRNVLASHHYRAVHLRGTASRRDKARQTRLLVGEMVLLGTTNCASATFHDWHLELFENPSDPAPQVGDPTPIVCEITPRTERVIYRDNVRIQSLAEFFRLQDVSYQATGHDGCKVRVTGYLLWDDDHNGSADVGSTIEWIGSNGFHHPWRSTVWEVHPIIKIK